MAERAAMGDAHHVVAGRHRRLVPTRSFDGSQWPLAAAVRHRGRLLHADRGPELGHRAGLSISDGTVQTNGVQPLATYVFSLPYWLSGGDKIAGIAEVELLSVIVSIAAAWFLYLLARKVLRDSPDARPLATLVAALWFASPAIVKHSMNGLETGIYLFVSLATLNVFLNFVESSSSQLKPKQMLELGVMLGLCFLARNDAAFLIAAVLLARIVLDWPTTVVQWRERIIETAVPGLISVLIAAPWLVYNYRLFGSIVPISGIAEGLGARFGQNFLSCRPCCSNT